ncbi:MAG: outer membrane lipoprotein LolB, partial [Legionellales bacterium]
MNKYNSLFMLSFCMLTACTSPKPMEELPSNKIMPLKQRITETATISSWEIDGAMSAKNKSKG